MKPTAEEMQDMQEEAWLHYRDKLLNDREAFAEEFLDWFWDFEPFQELQRLLLWEAMRDSEKEGGTEEVRERMAVMLQMAFSLTVHSLVETAGSGRPVPEMLEDMESLWDAYLEEVGEL